MQRVIYRLRYYWRKLCHLVGFCPHCGSRVNYTRSGAAVCPECRSR